MNEGHGFTIQGVVREDMVALLQVCRNCRGDCRHAGGKGKAFFSPFQIGNHFREHIAVGIPSPDIAVAFFIV